MASFQLDAGEATVHEESRGVCFLSPDILEPRSDAASGYKHRTTDPGASFLGCQV